MKDNQNIIILKPGYIQFKGIGQECYDNKDNLETARMLKNLNKSEYKGFICGKEYESILKLVNKTNTYFDYTNDGKISFASLDNNIKIFGKYFYCRNGCKGFENNTILNLDSGKLIVIYLDPF